MRILDSKDSLSISALVFANLIPLGGVLFADWDIALIVLLYWTENLIIGFYNVLKMALLPAESPVSHLGKMFFMPFFCLHYGGFCAGHGFFLIALFKIGGGASSVFPELSWPGPLVFLQMLISVIAELWRSKPNEMLYPFLGLLVSHGISFVQNYLLRKEYAVTTIKELMERPYKRIVILHIAIIAGGIFIMSLNSPLPLLLIIIFLKTGIDIYLHNRSHRSIELKKNIPSQLKETER